MILRLTTIRIPTTTYVDKIINCFLVIDGLWFLVTKPPDKLLTTAQVAERLGITKSSVADLCRKGLLPGAFKHGRAWRIPESSLENWQKLEDVSAREKWERFKDYPFVYWLTIFVGGLVAIVYFINSSISAGADYGPFQEALYERGWISYYRPREDDEILIIIGSFETGDEKSESDIQNELQHAILQQKTAIGLPNLRVEVDPTVISALDRNKAEEIGRRYNANVIIWGSDTDFRVHVNFLNLVDSESNGFGDLTLEETQRTIRATPNEYVTFVTEELSPKITFFSLYTIGQVFIADMNYAEALNVLNSSLEEYPINLELEFDNNIAYVKLLMASAYRGLGDLKSTEKLYLELLEQYPLFVDGWISYGDYLANLGDYENALSNYNLAISIAPENAQAYFSRGKIFNEEMDDSLRAIADFSQAITINSEESDYYSGRAFAYANNGDFDKALDDINRAVMLSPDEISPLLARAELNFNYLGNIQEALTDYDRAIELDQTSIRPYESRSWLYYRNNDLDKALDDINIAIELEPSALLG